MVPADRHCICYHRVATISPVLRVLVRCRPSPNGSLWWVRSHYVQHVDLAGAAEAADILGVTRQQVDRLAARPDFPKPVAVLRAGRIWRTRDIERWARQHADRRPGPPEKPYPPKR